MQGRQGQTAKWQEASSHASFDVERLGIPCLYDAVSTALKIAMKPPKPGAFPVETELNLR